MSPLTKHFHDAVLALAGHAPIKQRLVCAYSDHLSGVHDEDVPRRLLGRFSDLRRRLHSVTPLNGEGPVRASVRKMSGPEAADCAKIIVALYGEIAQWEAAASTGSLHLVRSPELEEVPDFLLKS